MKIEEINFDTLNPVKKKCVVFAKDGNTVVKPYRTLYSLEEMTHNSEHKTLFIEAEERDYGGNTYRLYESVCGICRKVSYLPEHTDLQDLSKRIANYEYFGEKGIIKFLQAMEANKQYINKVDIELCSIIGRSDLASYYARYRDAYLAEMEAKDQTEAAKLAAEQLCEKQDRSSRIEQAVSRAEDAVRSKGSFNNDRFGDTTVAIFLFKKYGIDVPIKTKGWINKALAVVKYVDGNITYMYYSRNSRDSSVFHKYLKILEEKILCGSPSGMSADAG